MPSVSPIAAIQRAQVGMRRAAVRRHLEAVASGKSASLTIDLHQGGIDIGGLVDEITGDQPIESIELQRLVVAFENSGASDQVIEQLTEKSPQQRVRSARIVGALRIYESVPWVAGLLESRDHSVADAAARALGQIGGVDSARALVKAIQRRGLNRRLVAELARSAPDLFIETALAEPQRQSVRPALAMAAGLRRRHAAVGPLMSLLAQGSRRERVISCRALGWIGSRVAVPEITSALQDRDWKIRMSAAKALGTLRAHSARDDLHYLKIDPNARVRKAAQHALIQLREAKFRGA
jgi:HEAT repeat protein